MFDMHCHILPKVDDGSRSWGMSVHMLRQAAEEGIRVIFATPHCYPEYWEYDPQELEEKMELLRELIRQYQIPIQLYLGSEVRWSSSVPERLAQGQCLTMAGTKYALVEFSVKDPIFRIEDGLQALIAAGYRPIIAHIERYESLRQAIHQIEAWVNAGVLVQCNASALSGADGMRMSSFSHKLMKQGLVHLIGTDAHSDKWRKPELRSCLTSLEKKYGADLVEELMIDNPQRLLRGEL